MPIGLYLDHNVHKAIFDGLRQRGVDVLRSFDDDTHEWDDADLLLRVERLGRVLFTQDDDFLALAVEMQRAEVAFPGVVYTHQLRMTVGEIVDDLALIAQASEREDWVSRVAYLPL